MSPDDSPHLGSHPPSARPADHAAIQALLPVVYEQLRRAAQHHMSNERAHGHAHTLSATALVHEVYLRLASPREQPWQNPAHYYKAAAEAMRRILIDHARAKARLRRGGGQARTRINLDLAAALLPESAPDEPQTDFIALDAALRRLEQQDPRAAEVVHLKFFAGLEIAPVAQTLGVSERTVKNDWAFAKAWLQRELACDLDRDPESDHD